MRLHHLHSLRQPVAQVQKEVGEMCFQCCPRGSGGPESITVKKEKKDSMAWKYDVPVYFFYLQSFSVERGFESEM